MGGTPGPAPGGGTAAGRLLEPLGVEAVHREVLGGELGIAAPALVVLLGEMEVGAAIRCARPGSRV